MKADFVKSMKSSWTLQDLEKDELDEQLKLLKPKNLDEGLKYRDKVTVNHYDPDSKEVQKLSVFDDIHRFMQFGHGSFMYFVFIKYTAIMLFFLALVSISPMIVNYSGGGSSAANIFMKLTLANLRKFPLNNAQIEALREDEDYINSKKKEYLSYYWVYMVNEIATFLIFFTYYFIVKRTMEKYHNIIEVSVMTVSDYTIEVDNLPRKIIPQKQIIDYFESNFGENVANVNFAYSFQNTLEHYQKLGELDLKKRTVKAKYEGVMDSLQLKQKEKELEKIRSQVKKEESQIREKIKTSSDTPISAKRIQDFRDLPVLKAYVTFEDHSSAEKIISDSKKNIRAVCGCCKKQVPEKFKFENQVLSFREPDHPINIKWENLEYTNLQRVKRNCLVWCIFVVLIVASLVVMIVLNVLTDGTSVVSTCGEDTISQNDLAQQIEDYAKDETARKKVITCYCSQQGISFVLAANESLQEPTLKPDDSDYNPCSEFRRYLIKTYILSAVSAVVVFVINFIINAVLQVLVEFQKFKSETSAVSGMVIKGFISNYINTAIVTILSTWDFGNFSPSLEVVSFLEALKFVESGTRDEMATFKELYRGWYINTGFKIVSVVLIVIISPHLLELLWMPFAKCFKNRKIEKAKLQIELNDILEPQPFDISNHYINALTIIFVVFTFSTGMPIIISLGFFSFLLIYWSQKYMFVTWMKKPPFWNVSLIRKVIKTLPYAIFFHLVLAIITLGNPQIFIHLLENQGYNIVENAGLSQEETEEFTAGYFKKMERNPVVTIMLALTAAYIILFVIFPDVMLALWFTICKKKNAVGQSRRSAQEQGKFSEVKHALEHRGMAAYDLRSNPKYKNIILLLDKAERSSSVAEFGQLGGSKGVLRNNSLEHLIGDQKPTMARDERKLIEEPSIALFESKQFTPMNTNQVNQRPNQDVTMHEAQENAKLEADLNNQEILAETKPSSNKQINLDQLGRIDSIKNQPDISVRRGSQILYVKDPQARLLTEENHQELERLNPANVEELIQIPLKVRLKLPVLIFRSLGNKTSQGRKVSH